MAKFNIDGILHRRVDKSHKVVAWVRRYARIETAVRRCTEFLILEGEVGDVIEFVLRLNGYQVGTIRMTATGRMVVVWNDKKFRKTEKSTATEPIAD